MKGIPTIKRFWFLDWFGCVLDYDIERKCIHRTKITPLRPPDLFMLTPAPFSFPSRVVLRQQKLIPSLPRIEMVDRDLPSDEKLLGRVGLKSLETHHYLTSNPNSDSCFFGTTQLWGCEQFIPLDAESFKALSILISPEMAEVKDSEGKVVSLEIARLHGKGDTGYFGDHEFPLGRNMEALAVIHDLKVGETYKLSLKAYKGEDLDFSVTRKADVEKED